MNKPGRTILWNLKPDAVIRKGLLIVVEAFLTALALVAVILVHRRILLMTEDDALAGSTFSRPFAALTALGLLFVTLEFPCTTGQAGSGPIVSKFIPCHWA